MKVSNTKTMTKVASGPLLPPVHALAGGLLMAMAACLAMTRSVAAGPVGACCMPCECLQTDEESCIDLGGSWQGPETDCLMCPTIPLFGACCLPDGTCSELSVLCCFDSGGVFQGDGVSCMPDPCLGACCFGGVCEDGLSELLCADLGGEHQGVGTKCPAPGGEDCNENGEDDAIDIYCGTSLDENGNGIPDECEQCVSDGDCNDGDPCTIETCDEGVCVQEDLSPCCGNGVIEAGEECDPPDGVTCDADCQLILCGPDEGCCCCPGEGCSTIDPVRCADMGCTPVEECLGDSNEDGEDDACVEACCLGDGSCKSLSEDECAGKEGTPVQACLGDQDGDGRDDACPCQTDADCDDGNPCTLNSCDQATGMCLAEFAPKSTPCEIDGELCSLEHCDGEGSCVPFGEVVCEASCPACEGECDPETGLCPCAVAKADGDWSDDIWNLPGPNPYPDNNTGVPGLGAVIQDFIDVFLNLTVEVESLCLLNGGILRVTAGGTGAPAGDITVPGPGGILIEGTLFVADSHTIDASAGPVTIGPNGKYLADPAANSEVNAVLLAGELTMLEAELPNEPGTMEMSDTMRASTAGDFTLRGPNFDGKGNCTPPDLSVVDSAAIEVGSNFVIENAGQVGYGSSLPLLLQGNFDNQSVFPEFFDWTAGGVLLTGRGGNAGPTVHTVEAAGEDRGRCATGFIDNFAFGTLELQSGEAAEIVNLIDNQDDGGEGCDEALYVDLLIVNDRAVLNTNGCRVYYRALIHIGSIPGIGVDVLEIERADFNEDCFVKAEDLAILLGNWGPCPPPCAPEGEAGMCPASCTPDVHAGTCPVDLSDDCDVEAFDLAILLGRWGPVD